MNKFIKSLFVVAGIAVAGIANAQSPTPAEIAGICSGNAYKIKQWADQNGIPEMSRLALEKGVRLFKIYGNQPGYDAGARYALNNGDDIKRRSQVFGGCTATGY